MTARSVHTNPLHKLALPHAEADPARPLVWVFAAAMALYVLQPLAPAVGGVPLQVILVAIVFCMMWVTYSGQMMRSVGIFSSWQWLAVVVVLGLSLSRDVKTGMTSDRFFQIVIGVMIALLGGAFFRSLRARSTLIRALTLAVVVSSLFAILQWAWGARWLWNWTDYTHYRYGSTGLERSPVPFGYSVVGIASLLTCHWFFRWKCRIHFFPLSPHLASIALAVVAAGLLASQSRSAMLGLVLAIMLAALNRRVPKLAETSFSLPRRRPRTSFSTVGIIAIVAAACLLVTATRIRTGGLSHALGDPRMVSTWKAYGPVILSNPFGVADQEKLAQEVYNSDIDRAQSISVDRDRLLSPHNVLLSTGVNYGLLGPLTIVVLYGAVFLRAGRCLARLSQSSQVTTAAWIVSLCAANVAVIAHSWFHNANLVMGEMRNWLWLGMLAAITADCRRVHSSQRGQTRDSG